MNLLFHRPVIELEPKPIGRTLSSRSVRKTPAEVMEWRRMLVALSDPGTRAVRDPFDEGMFLLNRTLRGVSVCGGRFTENAAEELVRKGFALWSGKALEVSTSGKTHLRRNCERLESDNPYRDQHMITEKVEISNEGGRAQVQINIQESPLFWLRRRKDGHGAPLIDARSFEAGERLRRDITLARFLPSVTVRWETTAPATAPSQATDRMLAARQRLNHAFKALGPDFTDLLIDLCGFLKGLELIERERGWPLRSGKVAVRLALAQLADHYGLHTQAQGSTIPRAKRPWHARFAQEASLVCDKRAS